MKLKVIRLSSKVRSIYFNSEENFLLNIGVPLRRGNIVATPDPSLSLSFAQGRAKVKLGGAC